MTEPIQGEAERKAARILAALHIYRRRPVKALSKTRRRDREQTLHWGWNGHIRGIGFGYKRTDDKADLTKPCLTVYVRRKLLKHRIPERERIPDRLRLVSVGSEVITDVIELSSPVVAHAAPNVQPGVDVAHRFGEAGTLGVLVRTGTSTTVLAASCSHVLARSGLGEKGDLVEHPPLVSATGGEVNEFGHLTDTFTRLNQSDTFDEDFALAAVDVPYTIALASNQTIIDTVADSRPGFSPGTPTSLQGFRSPDVPGEIINPEWHGPVEMPFVGTVQFQNLVPYSPGGTFGDSGAAVLEAGTSTILGLHVAGSDSTGFFMPLWPVFDDLGLNLVTS